MKSDKLRKLKVLQKMTRSYLGYKIGKPVPFVCAYYVDTACNLNCPYCPKNGDFKEKVDRFERKERVMSTSEAKKAIDRISSLGVSVFTFSGGEPLLRKDIFELSRFAKSRGMTTILYTNGTKIENDRSFKDAFDSVTISFPELKAKKLRTEEEIDKIKRGIRILKEANVKVGISLVISKITINDLEDITRWANDNVDFILYIPVHYAPAFIPDKKDVCGLEERLIKLKREYPFLITNSDKYIRLFCKYLRDEEIKRECSAFDLYLSLSPSGNLQGCSFPISFGNILEEDIGKIIDRAKKSDLLEEGCPGGVLEGCGQLPLLFKGSLFEIISGLKITKILMK